MQVGASCTAPHRRCCRLHILGCAAASKLQAEADCATDGAVNKKVKQWQNRLRR